jgi:hypothetical protein
MSNPGDNAVYNSRIAGMLTPSSSRRVSFVLILPILLLAGTAWGQNWAGAEEQLAAEIVAVTGTGTMTVEVENRPSSGDPGFGNLRSDNPGFGSGTAIDIRRGLLTQLAARGVRLVSAGQAAANVRVSLSGSLQSYVLVAEIQLSTSEAANPGSDKTANDADLAERRIVMVSLPRAAARAVESEAAAMVLHKTLLWAQAEQILDVAVLEGNPAHMLVLDSRGVTFYRQQDGRWQVEQSLAIAHSRPWPRDLRGRLMLHKDHVFDAYLSGVHCRSTATSPLAMNCFEGDDAWPVGTNTFSLNANFVSARNYLSGGLLPGVPGPSPGTQMTIAPFYSAAAIPRGESMWWLLASVDGQVHLLDGVSEQVLGRMEWGSDIASVRSGCGSGWQVLATGTGEGSRDTVQAFEVSDREPAAASSALEVDGSITALWTDSGEAGAVAVARNSETGGYEAFRLSVTCGR